METFLGALALAAITAISIIAYRHPKGYAKIFRAISELMIWTVFAIGGFAIGVEAAHRALIPYLRPDKVAEAAAILARFTPDPVWTCLGAFLIWSYFAFLAALPLILEHEPDEKT